MLLRMEGDMGHLGGLINPRPGRGQYRAGFSIPVGLPSLERGRRVKKIIIKLTNFLVFEITALGNTKYPNRLQANFERPLITFCSISFADDHQLSI